MSGMKWPWRKIVKVERYRYYKAHGDTIVLYLECGHEQSRKASQGIPAKEKVMCKQCPPIESKED